MASDCSSPAASSSRLSLRCCLALWLALAAVHAQEWPRFRGLDGTGTGVGPDIPATFTDQDFLFNTELPGTGASSPVLWGDKVFVTCSHDVEKTRKVLCLHAETGQQLWSWDTPFETYRHNRLNSYAASTPAVSQSRVVLTWISGQRFMVLALSHAGKLVWRRDLGSFGARHGAGASPAIIEGTVLVTNDNASGDSFLIGLDPDTGKTRWRQERRSEVASYVTPTVYRPENGQVEAVFSCPPHGITGVDPRTGRINWEVPGPFTLKSVACPVVADGLIYASAGRGGGGVESAAVRPGQAARVVHQLRRDLPYVPTPIAIGKRLFVLSDRGVLTCLTAATGKPLWRQQLGGKFYASPVSVNNRVYCISRKGDVTTVAADADYKLLGRCKLPEGTDATPAIANGRMYLRTPKRLVAIGRRAAP